MAIENNNFEFKVKIELKDNNRNFIILDVLIENKYAITLTYMDPDEPNFIHD